MPRKKHLPRAGSRITKQAAADVGPIIDRLIREQRGTPEDLVSEASDPHCPAHAHFEWNDEAAAHQHRLAQAREYFRFIVTIEPIVNKPMRAYLHISDEQGRRYEQRSKVRRSVSLMAQVMAEARDELEQWREQYAMLKKLAEFAGIFDAVEKLLKR